MCRQCAAACRQYEQLKLRYESLELRAQQAQQAAAAAAARAAEADSLAQRLERLQAEHAALRAASGAASDSQAGELSQLRAAHASLKDELADVRSVNEVLRAQLARQPSSAGGSAANLSFATLQQQPTFGVAGAGLGGLGGELERAVSNASLASSLAALQQRQASDAGGMLSPVDSLLSPRDAGGCHGRLRAWLQAVFEQGQLSIQAHLHPDQFGVLRC